MRSWWVVLVLVIVDVGCVDSSAVTCGPDQLCPSGSTCSHLTGPDEDICASPEQVSACAMKVEGDACQLRDAPDGWCHDGVCLPIKCGNNRRDLGEACDDGNTLTGDGTCSGDCVSTEQCGNGVIDPLARDELGEPIANESCDDANQLSGDGCSSRCQTEQPRWSRVGDPVIALDGSSLAYDPVRKRVVMFGGRTYIGNASLTTSSTYEFDGRSWAHIATTLAPSARRKAGMVYDAARRKIVLFGGQVAENDAPLGDLWEWDGAHWTPRTPPVSPAPRTEFGMVYDAARKKTVLFGGVGETMAGTVPLDDTWEWDGTSWTQIMAPTHPEARTSHVMAYDPKRAVTVMAGGYNDTTSWRDTWEYNGSWTRVSMSAPADLDVESTLAYDPVASRMIAFGGAALGATTASSSTWSFSGSTWTQLSLSTTEPGDLQGAAMVTDPGTGKVVLFGGVTSDVVTDATWLWNGAVWSKVTPFVPAKREHAASAYDPLHGVSWVYGGARGTTQYNSLLSFDGTTWTAHASPATTGRFWTTLAFDPLRDQLVMFGGVTFDASFNLVPATNETWVFNGTTWSSSTPPNSPLTRMGATAYFDPNRGKIVMFGGLTQTAPDAFLWEWTGTNWLPIATSELPSPRFLASLTFDAARGVCVLQAGASPANGITAFEDTWHFDGTTWTLDSASSSLPARIYTQAVYDAARRRELLFGGLAVGAATYGDTWQWDGTSWTQLLLVERPPSRAGHVTFPASDGRGIVIFGGVVEAQETPLTFADTWQLKYENAAPLEQCLLSVDDDGDGLVGCADPDCWSRCTPLCPPGAASCDPAAPKCGDGVCNAALESCRNCPQDCTTCTAACGDTYCDAPETLATCPGDCTP